MKRVLEFVYPPLCLHCQKKILPPLTLFCEECTPFFELIECEERCPYCFQEQENRKPCRTCVEGKKFALTCAAAFEHLGPVNSFTTALKGNRMPYLAKTAASFLALQLRNLSWKVDALYVPYFRRAQKQVAHELAQLLNLPLISKRKALDKAVLMIDLAFDRTSLEKRAEKLFPYYPSRVYALTVAY